jgi:DNA-binding response OmpR family regulator
MASKSKILVIDDEGPILKILGIKLRISGYEVITAPTGKKGLILIGSHQPDLVLLDVILPGMSGFQVLKKLRDSSRLPIIVFSARAENAQTAISLGADDFFPKPFDVDELVKRIDALLTHKI